MTALSLPPDPLTLARRLAHARTEWFPSWLTRRYLIDPIRYVEER